MANETIGRITCGWCGAAADVRKAAKGRRKLYVMCSNCGQQWLNTPGGQDIILTRAKMYGPEGAPVPGLVEEPAAEVAVEHAVVETPRKRGFFSLDF